jgi:hypothetical protein
MMGRLWYWKILEGVEVNLFYNIKEPAKTALESVIGVKGSKARGRSNMEKEITLHDIVRDPAQWPMDEAFNQVFNDDTGCLILALSSWQQAVVWKRFGLDDGKATILEDW